MGSNKHERRRAKRLDQKLRRRSKDARKLEVSLRAAASDAEHACDRLGAVAISMNEMLEAIGQVTAALYGAAARLRSISGTESPGPDIEELGRRLERVMVSQRRTNELLELALGNAFDMEIESAPR
jgi:hypothetical protein